MSKLVNRSSFRSNFSNMVGSFSDGLMCRQCRPLSKMPAVILAMSLLVCVPLAEAAPTATDVNGYEIPLGELQKVKKERPVKKESRERRKKKSDGAEAKLTYGAVVVPEQGEKSAGTASTVATPQTKNIVSSTVKPEASSKVSGPLTIHHDPYSYVIAGKRTTIQAIISSTANIISASCRFRSTESGVIAQVPMVTASGTFYTYTATLPGLAQGSKELRYSIVAVDGVGNQVQSQEFVVAVKASSVLPGWQNEITADVIKIKLEQKDKPLEGFADPGISE